MPDHEDRYNPQIPALGAPVGRKWVLPKLDYGGTAAALAATSGDPSKSVRR
jgi:hypothetical protein